MYGFPENACLVSVIPVFFSRCSLHISDLCVGMRELISTFIVLREGSQLFSSLKLFLLAFWNSVVVCRSMFMNLVIAVCMVVGGAVYMMVGGLVYMLMGGAVLAKTASVSVVNCDQCCFLVGCVCVTVLLRFVAFLACVNGCDDWWVNQ